MVALTSNLGTQHLLAERKYNKRQRLKSYFSWLHGFRKMDFFENTVIQISTVNYDLTCPPPIIPRWAQHPGVTLNCKVIWIHYTFDKIKTYLKIHIIVQINTVGNVSLSFEVGTLCLLVAEGEAVPQLVAVLVLQHVPHLRLQTCTHTFCGDSPYDNNSHLHTCGNPDGGLCSQARAQI